MELNSGLNGFGSCLVIGKVNDVLARIIKNPYRNIILSALKEQRDGEKRKKKLCFFINNEPFGLEGGQDTIQEKIHSKR